MISKAIQRAFVLFTSLIFLCPSAQSVELKISGKNGEVLFQKDFIADLSHSLGLISVEAFAAYNIPFQGGEEGVASLFNLGSDMDVISDTEMKAYGWCFSVDGKAPDVMGDKFFVPEQEAVIHWYYAYAHYKAGQWVGVCVVDK